MVKREQMNLIADEGGSPPFIVPPKKLQGWSLEQKEAILKAVFRWEDGLKGNTQPAHNEKLLERLEAITKGEEQ